MITKRKRLSEKQERKLWKELRNIPVNNERYITEPFHNYPAGTDREKIWHYLEDNGPIPIYRLMGLE